MKVVAQSRRSGQKGEVRPNKEPPVVPLPKEDRKAETMACSCSTPPPHPTFRAHLKAGANHPAGEARIKADPFSQGHQRCGGNKGERSGKTFGKAKVISLLDHRTPLHNKHKGSDPSPFRRFTSFT
ncbi:uncharacterized [Tachysurus ichikawai]